MPTPEDRSVGDKGPVKYIGPVENRFTTSVAVMVPQTDPRPLERQYLPIILITSNLQPLPETQSLSHVEITILMYI